MNPRVFLCSVLVVTAVLGSSSAAAAAPGDLDSTFGNGGKVVSDFDAESDTAQAVVLQPDGKILVAAGSSFRFGVARYNANGTPDASFSGDGLATADFGPGGEFALALARQNDGKIVVAGNASPGGFCCQFALARFNGDGTLDATFDQDGVLTTPFGGFTTALGVAVQPDGRIVAVGSTFSPFGSGFAIARYNADGSLDATFDGDGTLTTTFAGGGGAGAVVLQPDGKIVAVGTAANDFAVARYNADGSPDASFDGDGMQTTDFGGFDSIGDVALQPDGRIVAAGIGRERFALARYLADGSLDPTFDGDGKVTTQFFGENIEAAAGVALQQDGKLVAVGSAFATFDSKFALARYNQDGSLDTTFSGDGLTMTDFGDPADVGRLCPPARSDCSEDAANDVAVQPDGRIVAVGGGGPCIPSCLTLLARYQGDGIADATPPELSVPAAIAVDATGPDGAVVTYTASATDDVDGSVPVTCVPAPGNTFEIGTTPVTCSAEDAAGNGASAGFDVHVRSADEQLDELIAVVVGVGPGTSLRDKLESVQSALEEGDLDSACGQLKAFGNQVRALSGRTIGVEQAQELIAAADRIRAVLDC